MAMKNKTISIGNSEGFVLVAALLIMLVLTILGIATTTNTSIELQIASNDKVNKKTYFEAEAGAALGTEIIEQSFSCVAGFKETDATNKWADLGGTDIRVYSRDGDYVLYNNARSTSAAVLASKIGDPDKADAAYPKSNLKTSGTDDEETGYLYFEAKTMVQIGGALQMTAGYEGKGKSAGQGGVAKVIDVYSQFAGQTESQTTIAMGWRHLVGTEDPSACQY